MRSSAFVFFLFVFSTLWAENLTTGSQAKLFGVHQISLTGSSYSGSPNDVLCKVTFQGPGGISRTVEAFFDGGSTWKARCYVNRTGTWSWSSSSSNGGLGGKSGSFSVVGSSLRGMIITHPANKTALATENGKWFSCVGDTGYFMLGNTNLGGNSLNNTVYRTYTQKLSSLGINIVRANLFGGLRTDAFHTSGDDANLGNLQNQDGKLTWMLDNYPGMYLQLIIWKEYSKGLADPARTRFLRQMTGRWGAFPTITWMVMNDTTPYSSGSTYAAVVNYTLDYLSKNSPFGQMKTTGTVRGGGAPFANDSRVKFLHFETLDALAADQTSLGRSLGKFAWMGEDRYSTYKAPADKTYFFRRITWAWLISGGSACYGGDWDNSGTYHFSGAESFKHINPYFENRGIDMGNFTEADGIGKNVNNADGLNRLQVARRGNSEFLVYHCNNNGQAGASTASSGHAQFKITLPAGNFSVEWFNPATGASSSGAAVSGGAEKSFTSPYTGDVVCRLRSGSTPPPEPNPDILKPSMPGGVKALAQSSSSILVSWTASTDNVGVTAYDVYRGTTKVGSTATTSFSNTGLSPSTAYAFKVQARDAAGNLSDFSATASATTLSGPVDPPVVGGSVYQAEAAVVVGGVKHATYVDYINASGDYIEWTVNVSNAGAYDLSFKYAISSGNRPLEIKVNGVVVSAKLDFPGTGSISIYKSVSMRVNLPAGISKIRATAIGYSGGNMDSLTVSPL